MAAFVTTLVTFYLAKVLLSFFLVTRQRNRSQASTSPAQILEEPFLHYLFEQFQLLPFPFILAAEMIVTSEKVVQHNVIVQTISKSTS